MFLAISVETSGPSLRKHFMTRFAAALVSIDGANCLAMFSSFLPPPDGREWNSIPFPEIERGVNKARPMDDVMQDFEAWTIKHVRNRDVTVIFDSVGADQPWMDYYLPTLSCNYLTGSYRATVDVTSWFHGLGQYTVDVSMKNSAHTACESLGIGMPEFVGANHVHDLRHDAKELGIVVATVTRRLRGF